MANNKSSPSQSRVLLQPLTIHSLLQSNRLECHNRPTVVKRHLLCLDLYNSLLHCYLIQQQNLDIQNNPAPWPPGCWVPWVMSPTPWQQWRQLLPESLAVGGIWGSCLPGNVLTLQVIQGILNGRHNKSHCDKISYALPKLKNEKYSTGDTNSLDQCG